MNRRISMTVALLAMAFSSSAIGQDVTGDWQFLLNVGTETNSIELPFQVSIGEASGVLIGEIINGNEHIPVGPVEFDHELLTIRIPHYASQLNLRVDARNKTMSGDWSKVRGKDNVANVPCQAVPFEELSWSDPKDFVGRWSVKFEDSEDLAVAVFEKADDTNQVLGTFLTTTGDYRYLAGGVIDGDLKLSCFDGAHAFLFTVEQQAGDLKGVFHSGNWYQTSWTAVKDKDAVLPDAFAQTVWTDKVPLEDLKFRDLDGKEVALTDSQFAGKCKIIEVFGSWCPNCHDAGVYLSELNEKYAVQGLSIVGLAFELTGEFERDADQVREFAKRNNTKYPMLIAGTADKAEATKQLQVLDRVRSYPTMIFLDEADNVKAIYTGFSGPATGKAHAKLRKQFEGIIEGMLNGK